MALIRDLEAFKERQKFAKYFVHICVVVIMTMIVLFCVHIIIDSLWNGWLLMRFRRCVCVCVCVCV